MNIRPATWEDHAELCRIARTHRAGQGFSHFMFSGEVAYQKGWLRVAIGAGGTIMGFTCVRQKVRIPKTMLYYIVIDPTFRRLGIGQGLLNDLIDTSPHRCIELSCLKDNAEALAFYSKNGFNAQGESLKGKGWHLEKSW